MADVFATHQTFPPNTQERLEASLKDKCAEVTTLAAKVVALEGQLKNAKIMLDREKETTAAYRRVLKDLSEDF